MGKVLVKGAVIQCPHGGQLKLTSGDARLAVAGMGVVTSGMEIALTFGSPVKPVPGMVSPCTAGAPNNYVPCVTSAAVPAGLAKKLAVGNVPVLLDSASGPTVSAAGAGIWSVTNPGQQKLEAT